MKRIYLLLPVLLLVLISCEQDEPFSTQDIRFSIPFSNAVATAVDLTSLELTLVDASGRTILTNQKVSVERTGDQLVTDNITIPNGSYTIDDFLVSDKTGRVLYALPKSRSSVAITSGIAPVQFTLDVPTSSPISVSVLSVEGKKEADFGYAPGRFKTYDIHVAVSVESEGKLKLTDATAYIQSADGENYKYDLTAKVNTLTFAGDPNKQYELRIWKEGYKVHVTPFIYNELHDGTKGKPLDIVLEQENVETGPTLSLQPSSDLFSMWIEVSQQGMIILDWGNGEKESLMFNVDPENMTATGYFYRDRSYSGDRPLIKITGDVHLVTAFYLETSVSSLDLAQATALREIFITDSDMDLLSLEANTNLQAVSFSGCTFNALKLPQKHAINTLQITTNGTWPSASQLDYIIDNVHMNVVAANIIGGYLDLTVNEISEHSTANINELKDAYGWTVNF